MKSPKVSIILPVYNAADILNKKEYSICHILNQTYTDFELIIVNDGSTDMTGIVCDDIASVDSRVKVIHKENGGVSSARNIGLDNASGEYITFSDADDWMDECWLATMVDNMYDVDMVITNWQTHRLDGTVTRNPMAEGMYSCIDYIPICTQLMNEWQIGLLWCTMFRRSVIEDNKLRLLTTMNCQEDLEFMLRYILCTNSFRLINGFHYHYYYMGDRSRYYFDIPGVHSVMASLMKLMKYEDTEYFRLLYGERVVRRLLTHTDFKTYNEFFAYYSDFHEFPHKRKYQKLLRCIILIKPRKVGYLLLKCIKPFFPKK